MIKSRPSQRSRGQVIDLFPKDKNRKRKSSCGFRFFFVLIPRAPFVIPSVVERSHHLALAEAFATRPHRFIADLSQIAAGVAITSVKILHNFCLSPQTALPLHRRKETDDNVNNIKFNN